MSSLTLWSIIDPFLLPGEEEQQRCAITGTRPCHGECPELRQGDNEQGKQHRGTASRRVQGSEPGGYDVWETTGFMKLVQFTYYRVVIISLVIFTLIYR